MSEMVQTGKLAQKIALAALDVGGKLKADKTNQEQKYNYISADKILSIGGQALFNQGLVVLPIVTEQSVTVWEYAGGAKRRYDAQVTFSFNITDGSEIYTCAWFGLGSDYSVPDKALYKAITSGHKYFLMKLLCIGAGNEDAEHETPQDEGTATRQAVKPAQAPKAANPIKTYLNPTDEEYAAACAIRNAQGMLYAVIPADKIEYVRSKLKATPETDEQKAKLHALDVIEGWRKAHPVQEGEEQAA